MDLKSLIAKMDAIEAKESLQEATTFQFSPEQEKWLGGADRQDPYILNRMPGQKPPFTHFTDPADQELAKRMGFPAAAVQPVVQAPVAQQPAANVAPTHPADTSSNKPTPPAGQSGMPTDNTELLNKLKRLEELVDKYNKLKSVKESSISIERALIESFNTNLDEEFEIPSWADIKNNVKSGVKKVGSKLIWPITASVMVWDAWSQLEDTWKDSSISFEKKVETTTRVVSKIIAEFGIFMAGGIIGGAMAGVISGPGAIAGFIAGGFIAQYLVGDDANAIIDSVVDYFSKKYVDQDKKDQTATQQDSGGPTDQKPVTPQSTKGDPDVAELQTALQQSGATNSDGTPLTVDGVMGPNTITAIQKELAGLGATNQDGTPLTIDGKLGPNTAAAIKQYYLS